MSGMDSFSWTRDRPAMDPPEWRYGGPKPDGYRWPLSTLTPGLLLTCAVCCAAVSPGETDGHDEWHRTQSPS